MGVYKRKNGYCVKINYTDEKGNYKQIFRSNKFTKTKAEAKQYEMKLLNDLQKKVVDEKVSFDDLFLEYLTQKKQQLKNSTIKSIKTRYNLHIKDFFENMNIYSITLKNVIHWQNKFDKSNYCVAHKNKILTQLISIIKYGVNVYGINDFTPKISKFKDANSIEKEMKYYTYDEFIIFSSNLKKWVDDDFFVCGYTEPISPSYVDSVNNHIANISNLKHIRIHDYRHSYCSLLINGGIPLLAVSKLLGHSTIDVTQKVYSHIYPSQCDEALNYLNSLKK